MHTICSKGTDFDNNERRFAAAALVIILSFCEKLSTIRIADFPALIKEYLLKKKKKTMIKPLTTEGVAEYEIDCLVAPGTSSTKNICLSHAEVSGSTLCMMSRAPKALETLKIFVGGLRQRDPGRYSKDPKSCGRVSSSTRIHCKCLSSTCQSLNTQKVKFGGRSDEGALLGPPYYLRESPFRLIDALPPNLEYLCL
ncbi:hypothetical protein HZ326_8596 [Fusarium oxysporum f. sp. albedinis]|nr:hypothetical protein HZ326_8596 [Fusarium oxysporum f. sp. albedinis]